MRIVEGIYEDTKDRVMCGARISEEFRVNVGQRQGNALSPLFFIALLDVFSRNYVILTDYCLTVLKLYYLALVNPQENNRVEKHSPAQNSDMSTGVLGMCINVTCCRKCDLKECFVVFETFCDGDYCLMVCKLSTNVTRI